MADTYGQKLYPMLERGKPLDVRSVVRYRDISAEEYVRIRVGETPNHEQQFLANLLWTSYSDIRPLVLDFYSSYIFQVGLYASGGSDEALFSKSHRAHFDAAIIPMYLAALRMEDDELRFAMARVIRMSITASKLLTNKKSGKISAIGARFTTDADQRVECERTHAYLRGEKVRMPRTLTYAPSWLGLYCLTLAKKEFPEKFAYDFSGKHLAELPPLKNLLRVWVGKDFHFAKFMTTDKMMLPCRTVFSDYSTGAVIHGGIEHLDIGKEGGKGGKVMDLRKMKKEMWAKEEICPVELNGVGVKVVEFRVAKEGSKG